MKKKTPKNTFSSSDVAYMAHALSLADRVKGTTNPNPAVGAVIVKKGKIIGEGATAPVGGPHAEIVALGQAGTSARGATLYVTLEPCNHHGRTPPCTDSIIAAGISRVVVACVDENPRVGGKGLTHLSDNGIDVSCGLLTDSALRRNEDFFYSIKTHKPWITLKLALTLDGRVADANGESKWITGVAARTLVHDLRRCHTAVAVGSGTLRADNPELTVRLVKGRSPVRIILASTSRVPKTSHFVTGAKKIRSIIVVPGAVQKKKTHTDGYEIWTTGQRDRVKSFEAFLKMAYQEHLTSILFEGGAGLGSFLLEHDFVNRLYLFYGNKIIGGGLNGIGFLRSLQMKNALELKDIEIGAVDEAVMVTGKL